MRSYQVFAGMSAQQAERVLGILAREAPDVFDQALGAASTALKARPVYLQRQPFPRRAAAVRRALSRISANELAEEILAVYFLECRKPLLVEWLEAVGVAHEDGTLTEAVPSQPDPGSLRSAVRKFRQGADGDDREILLRAFTAQSAVDWPVLEALVAEDASVRQ